MDRAVSMRNVRTLLFVAALVVVWRAAVAWNDLTGIDTGGGWVKIALGLMGLGYLACGLPVLLRVRSRPALLFTVHCLGQAVHWGGLIEPPPGDLRTTVILVYLVVSMLGVSAFLHFTLVYPEPWRVATRRVAWFAIYVPVMLAGVIAVLWSALPGPTPFRGALLAVFGPLESIQVNLYALLGIVAIVIRFLRANREQRRGSALGVMLSGAVLAPLPWVVASLAGLDAEPFTLLFILTPAALAYSILRNERECSQDGRHE